MISTQEPGGDAEGDVVGEVEREILVVLDRWSVGQVGWPELVVAAAVVAVSVGAAFVARRLVRRSTRTWDGPAATAAALIGKVVSIGIYLVAAALVLPILGFDLGPVLIMALIALGALVVIRPILTNLSSGLVLQLQGSVRSGDTVAIGEIIGVVEEVATRTVLLTTIDGRSSYIPNTQISEGMLTNYSKVGRRRSSLELRLPDGADVRGFSTAVTDVASQVEHVLAEPPPNVVASRFDGPQLYLMLNFWHGPEIEAEEVARDEVALALVDLFNSSEFGLADASFVVHATDRTE